MAPNDGTEVPLPQPSWTTKYAASVAERVVRAFIVGFAGVYIAALLAGGSSAVSDMSVLQKAGTAGLIAAINLVVSLFAKGVGNNGTPAVLPTRYDPATRVWSTALQEKRVGRRGDEFLK